MSLGSKAALEAIAGEPQRDQNIETVSIGAFVQKAKPEIMKLKDNKVQKKQFLSFCGNHGLKNTDKNFGDYLIAKMNYEAFRYAGFMRFGFIYPYIDKDPHPNITIDQLLETAGNGGFEAIRQKPGSVGSKKKAKAATYSLMECDTGAAFYVYITQKMGVGSGLKWPASNPTQGLWKSIRRDITAYKACQEFHTWRFSRLPCLLALWTAGYSE